MSAVWQQGRADVGAGVVTENMEESCREEGASSLHERLVAYVHTLEHGSRRGVWGEHSYARARLRGERGAASPRRHARALLQPRPLLPPPALLDVLAPPEPPPEPPALCARAAPAEPEPEPHSEQEEEWEARVAALAPSRLHAALAAGAADALRRLRLQRLARGAGDAREAAARLRRALAPAWLVRGAPAWLHATLTACLPRSPRRLYEETLEELRRAAPRLAARLTSAPAPARGAAARLPAAVGPASEPWLVWVSSGCAALDARWERRLAAQVHTRVLRAPGAASTAPPEAWCAAAAGAASTAPPEAWCAAAAGAVRDQLTDALAEAGDRSIILGGVGAGAALCLLLARGAGGAGGAAGGVRGAVLVAPALRTAEGGRAARDDALHAVRLPLLLVVGTHASDCPRSIANDVCERGGGGGGGGGARRVLEVHGADAQLRLSRRQRRRLALPQEALDAALVEECVRWAVETAEGEGEGEEEETPRTTPPSLPRRHPLPTIVHQIDLDGPEEEYAHLPAGAPPGPPAAPSPLSTQSARSIEIVEGRVVSRSAGGTPLTLLPPPRRSAPPSPGAPAPPEPSAIDIMQMPIVFADDNATGAESSSAGSPVTVTSGKARSSSVTPPVKMTRVILAKRGAGGGAGSCPGRGAGGAAPRRLLLRRGMRLVPRPDKP